MMHLSSLTAGLRDSNLLQSIGFHLDTAGTQDMVPEYPAASSQDKLA